MSVSTELQSSLRVLPAPQSEALLRLCEMEITRRENPRWFLGSEIHRTVRGEPLDFERSPFLKPIYQDQAPRMVIKKCVQVGITTLLECDVLASADSGMRIMYILPKIDIRNTFVQDRMNRLLLTIPYYRNRMRQGVEDDVPEIDSVGLKAFGKIGVILFVGSNSKSSFIMFAADKVIVDERDFCEEANLDLAEDRMKHSPYRHRIDVSTPTREDEGIDRLYNESDQKRWFVTCEHCGHRQVLDFFTNVIREIGDREYELLDNNWTETEDRDLFLYCSKCKKPINRLSPGEWVAAYPDRGVSGYAISGLMSAERTVRSLWLSFLAGLQNESKMQVFMNSDLGLAYTAAGQKLTPALLNECIKAGLNYNMPSRSDETSAGVDVGHPLLHIQICDHPQEGKRRLVWAGTCRDFEELYTVFARFNTKWAVIDEKPETRKVREFQEGIKGRCKVWLCRYPGAPQSEPLRVNEEDRIIVADRTQVLDAYVADVCNQAVLLPANAESLDNGEFYRQLCAPTRVFNEDRACYEWTEGSKADHYFHAGSYERIAGFFVSKQPELAQQGQKKKSFPHRRQGLRRD